MEKLLREIETALTAPETQWRSEPEHGLTVYHGDANPWRLLVVSQGGRRMATATHLKQFLVVKMTDALADLAYAQALKAGCVP